MGAAAAVWPDSAEFIPLSSGALIAYYNIAGTASTSAGDLPKRLDAVAHAIASLVPIYTLDEGGLLRPLTKLELALSEFAGGGSMLVHRDRDLVHADLRIQRRDLLDALHALQDVYRRPTPSP
jgi:hypothetical protein